MTVELNVLVLWYDEWKGSKCAGGVQLLGVCWLCHCQSYNSGSKLCGRPWDGAEWFIVQMA